MTLKTYNEKLKRIRANPEHILSIPHAERTEALLREALKRDENLLYRFLPWEMDETFAKALVAVQPRRLDYLPKHLLTTEVLELAIEYREMLKYAPESSLTDVLVDDALALFPLSVVHLPAHWVTLDRARYVVNQDAVAFEGLPPAMRTEEMARSAVKLYGNMLLKVDLALWDDALVDSALHQTPAVIYRLHEPWLNEERIRYCLNILGGSHLKLYRHTPEHLKTDDLKWRFLQRGIDVIEDITVPEFKHLLADFHPVEPLFALPHGLDSALRLVNKENCKASQQLGAKYIAATFSLKDLSGKRLDARQVKVLSEYYGMDKLLASVKIKPEQKRELLGYDLDL